MARYIQTLDVNDFGRTFSTHVEFANGQKTGQHFLSIVINYLSRATTRLLFCVNKKSQRPPCSAQNHYVGSVYYCHLGSYRESDYFMGSRYNPA